MKAAHRYVRPEREIDEALAGGTAQGFKEQETADNGDCADTSANRKALATMTAQAAACGCTLHELATGGYLLCRWGMSKELPCLRAVGEMLRRIGGGR
jgi:hypothetical protein